MGNETRLSKNRDERDDRRGQDRQLFIDKVSEGVKIVDARKACNITAPTAKRLVKAFKARESDPLALAKMLDPHGNRAGRRPVLTRVEQEMIVKVAERAELRGAAIGIEQVKILIADICNDGRSGFKNLVPSDACIRKFRAENRTLTVRTHRPKDIAKVKAESYHHVKSFQSALQHAEKDHPGLYARAEKVWNFDETHVNSERNRKHKVLSSTRIHQGAATRVSGIGKGGKHVTDVVAVSASGDLAELFLIVEGEYVMTGWFNALPLRQEDVKVARDGVDLRPYCKENWFPKDGCVQMQGNGSMTKDLMPVFLQHLRAHIDKSHPHLEGTTVAVLSDGHSSRSKTDIRWLEKGRALDMAIVLSPANTTHFLQACDQLVNQVLSHWVTKTKEAMLANGIISVNTVQAKFIMAVESHRRLAASDIVKSWEKIGMYPMNYRFLDLFLQKYGPRMANALRADDLERVQTHTVARKSDAEISAELKTILDDQNLPASHKLQRVAVQIHRDKTTNSILQEVLRPPQRTPAAAQSPSARMIDGQATHSAGTPAQYVTHESALRRFQEDARQKEQEQQEKERKKADRVKAKEDARVRKLKAAQDRAKAASERAKTNTIRKRALEETRAEKAAQRAAKHARSVQAAVNVSPQPLAPPLSPPRFATVPLVHEVPEVIVPGQLHDVVAPAEL